MLKVVLDTNVLISAALSQQGNPAKIVNLAFDGAFSLYCDDWILLEYITVFSRPKFNFSSDKQEMFIRGIKRARVNALDLPVIKVSEIFLPDESDRKFYDIAKSCDAFLITGNIKHYPNEPMIVTPSFFLTLLQPSLL